MLLFCFLVHNRYLLITCGFVYFYCMLYQGVSEEEIGGAWELLKEGFMTSFAIFLVSDTYSFELPMI